MAAPPVAGEIALLLPVKVEAGEGHAWIRLGLMDLIAERLRAAGQAVVPSDTVIALLDGAAELPGPDDVDRLAAATGARLVLEAHAEVVGTRWTVSLHNLLGAGPPVTAAGEAHDVLEAAHACADRMALALGLTPATDPDTDRDLQMLLQKIRAATLAQQMHVARALIGGADPRLRRHPEIRFEKSRIEYYSHRLDAAQAAFDPLLEETPPERDPVLRARILNGLAAVHARRGDWDTAEPMMEEAARLLTGPDPLTAQDPLGTRGLIHMNLGAAALGRGDVEAAREHVAQARRLFLSIGDVQKLAVLDLLLGVLEGQHDRWTEALRYFQSAADRHAAVHDAGSELHARAHLMTAHLELLDPRAALAVEPRVIELLAQTDNPMLAATANLTRVDLLEAIGRPQAARSLLRDVTVTTETREDLYVQRMEALVRTAERAARDDDDELAAQLASEVADRLAPDRTWMHDSILGRAWLVLVRANLSRGDLPAAKAASAAITDLADHSSVLAPKIYAALAQAALAAAEARRGAAKAAFELALTHADAGRVPRHLLQVAQSYVPWLLREGTHGAPDLGSALRVADRVAPYADQHYDAALLQLRVYHASGPPSAWRTALARARSLTGERPIPPELLTAPRSDRESTLNEGDS